MNQPYYESTLGVWGVFPEKPRGAKSFWGQNQDLLV